MRGTRIDDNESCWLEELPPYEPAAPLARDIRADVAIIGGGLTGVSTAWHLSERWPDRRIVLLEAKALANGASGRNGGQVLNGVNGVEPTDAASACAVYDATTRGIDIVERLAGCSTLDAGFVRTGCFELSTTARGAEAAEASVARANAWGIPLRWLPAEATGLSGAYGAVLDPGAGRANVAALVRGLRGPLADRGVQIYERSPVSRIEEGPIVTLHVGSHTVVAATIVLATNAYTPALGYFRAGILPLHSHVVATAPLPSEVWKRLGWPPHEAFTDDLDRIGYGCRTPAGRLLFGGGANAAYTYRFGGSTDGGAPPAHAFATVARRLADYVPGIDAEHAIVHRWSGPLAITFDRVCSMGVTGRWKNVYYALGYSGHGLALAALAGQVLTDLHAGDIEPWRDLPFYQRRLPSMPPEPLRWAGYQIYTRLTGRSPRRK